MFALKPISHETVAGALAKAERYRLLNEPGEAESICCDILEVDPGNEEALISLTLAQTDQIAEDGQAFANSLATAARLRQPYDRAYYSGIVWERRAKARHRHSSPGTNHIVYEWIVKALQLFAEAERLRPAGNDDAVLRWNACVRFLASHAELCPRSEEVREAILSE
jgi:hypothetical protein